MSPDIAKTVFWLGFWLIVGAIIVTIILVPCALETIWLGSDRECRSCITREEVMEIFGESGCEPCPEGEPAPLPAEAPLPQEGMGK